jgi:hypothetical protein
MSEQQGEPIRGENGPVGTVAAALRTSDASSEPVAAQAGCEVEAPRIAPDQEETAPKADTPKVEATKADAVNAEAPKVEASEPEVPPFPGKLMIVSPGDRSWNDDSAAAKATEGEAKSGTSGKRRVAAMAAVVVLATVAGALGGALATASLGHFARSNDSMTANNNALQASIARIEADISNLKVSVEHTAKVGMSQFNKTNDRLDKVERAQAEPAAKLAKLSEAVDKLRAASSAAAVAAQPAAAKDVTGTVAPPATTTAAAAPAQAKPEVGRLPTVEGWVLRDVANGSALIEGRRGMYEVYAGDPIPGLGRVDAIRRQDGRWVVVTSKGLIVAR